MIIYIDNSTLHVFISSITLFFFFFLAISVLKDKEPGCFIVRDSHSFKGAYGLAMKVATPPPSVLQQTKKGEGLEEHILRFLGTW